jgi:hypothetical protein
MGIYITQKQKEEWEDKIAELEYVKSNCKSDYEWNESVIEQNVYKKILSSSTVLPSEESWDDVPLSFWHRGAERIFPNGVIIRSKENV